MDAISTDIFLPVFYQMAARLNSNSRVFKTVLFSLIKRCVGEQPYRTVYVVLALRNAHMDDEETSQDDLITTSERLITQLKQSSKNISKLIENTQRLCEGYIQLANYKEFDKTLKKVALPASLLISKVRHLDMAAIPTVNMESMGSEIVTVQCFEKNFSLAGGINVPKIVTCLGSDGNFYQQLVKGNDDLRQDAVMQQLFGVVNRLVQVRNISQSCVATYKIIPLSQKSGVLEWCKDTIPIGTFLADPKNGAHKRYRLQDFSTAECRKRLSRSHKSSNEEKFKVFMKICQNFKPVMRYFFFENWKSGESWWLKQSAYIRSVAINSMVGYIVGLGDRHVQNILINKITAEVVHIDFGVAFEQGMILPTPETVPFRLTRDIVDGMGITGVDGAFTKCCEENLSVLKAYYRTLLCVVEVFLHDPLCDWKLSPTQEKQLDKSEVSSTNKQVAERALLRIRQKLQGTENGVSLSVKGQVQMLIKQAMNPRNLSRLFPGWQPYL